MKIVVDIDVSFKAPETYRARKYILFKIDNTSMVKKSCRNKTQQKTSAHIIFYHAQIKITVRV
ncbi:hypothetical protein O59_003471 [Cellvibrio sp. BR]|nr:hypothetical protein O59_003471 [Cellvibrio sp. BR]